MVQGRPQILLLAVFCMAAGFSCKAGLMPLHPWLPIAHPVAPAPASAVLSGPDYQGRGGGCHPCGVQYGRSRVPSGDMGAVRPVVHGCGDHIYRFHAGL